ncbi:leucyl aminopeptidase [Silvimonas sp. JCM 19000]
MEFNINLTLPENDAADSLVLPVAGKKLSGSLSKIDAATGGSLTALLASGELADKTGSTLVSHVTVNGKLRRAILVQLGETTDLVALRTAAAAAARAAIAGKGVSVGVHLLGALSKEFDLQQAAAAIAHAFLYEGYRFDQFKSKADAPATLNNVTLAISKKDQSAAAEAGVAYGVALGHGVNFTRDLGNTPPNVCTPTYLAEQAIALGQSGKNLEVEILDEPQIAALGMNSFLAVAKGSVEPPKLITMNYKGGQGKPVVLVGKGITFDTGGISLKPGEGMDEMKYDMLGAGAVLGVMKAVVELQLPINVVGVIATCENMPAGNALKPGDIVTSMSGQTIEVLNTDAEGRLILCDALTFAGKFDPETVIDLATLTGACVIALGHIASGLYANDEALAAQLLAAADASGDKTWRMPLWDDYQDLLKSNFADMANIGGRPGGSITAACFLARYTKAYRWAHFDIAGTAWKSGAAKGATGRPVSLLLDFLSQRAAQAPVVSKAPAKSSKKK